MFIIHIATEIAKLVKVGGLGDVIYGLSKELIKQKEQLLVILPYYDCIDSKQLKLTSKTKKKYPVLGSITFHKAMLEDIPLVLVEEHHEENYFKRGAVYGEIDDIDRFLFFCCVCVQYLTEVKADCIHVHDWPTAMVISLIKAFHEDIKASCMLTIHNMKHQGRSAKKHLTNLLLKPLPDDFLKKSFDPNNPSLINIIRSGIEYADHITTVSSTYSKEIQTSEFGYSLDKLLTSQEQKITGVLNGIDFTAWNPTTDSHIFLKFPSIKINDVVLAKKKNKEELLKELKLKDSSAPLYGCVTRLDDQKGPKLILHAIKKVIENNGYFILLGTPSSPEIKKQFDEIKLEFKNSEYFHYHDKFDEDFAHKIYASSDFILIPSIFEPCGLTQMIAMRYGSIPLARKTGGLADTVFDLDDCKVLDTKKTGLNFEKPENNSINELIKRSFELYNNEKKMNFLIENCLSQDNSWQESADKYKRLYKKIL